MKRNKKPLSKIFYFIVTYASMIRILCTLQKNTVANKQGSAYIAHITCVVNKHTLDRSHDAKKKLQSTEHNK